MFPIIFSYKGIQISSYGLMLVILFLTCNYLLRRYLKQKNKDPQIADDMVLRAAIGGVIGAKLYYLLENINNGIASANINGLIDAFYALINTFYGIFTLDSSKIAFSGIIHGVQDFFTGLVFLGGLIGGMISVTLYLRKHNINWFEAADWVAPYLALGHAIGRIGCFLVGDCYGTTCNLPWAVQFKNGFPPTTFESFRYNYPEIFNGHNFQSIYSSGDLISVHPTQIYESLLYILVFAYLIHIRKRKSYNGVIMFEYLFLVGLSRFLVEFLRLNPSYLLGLSGAQIISASMMIISSYLMYINRKKLEESLMT